MQNIVEIVKTDNLLSIVLRDVTTMTYSTHAYKRIPNGEFTRTPGALYKGSNLDRAVEAANQYVKQSFILRS